MAAYLAAFDTAVTAESVVVAGGGAASVDSGEIAGGVTLAVLFYFPAVVVGGDIVVVVGDIVVVVGDIVVVVNSLLELLSQGF